MEIADIVFYVVMLIIGLVICLNGKRLFKLIQMVICGSIGCLIGMYLEAKTGLEWFFYLALVLMLVGIFLGVKYYKVPLGISSAIICFLVIFSYFWKLAVAQYNEGIGQLMNTGELVRTGFSGVKSFTDIGPAIHSIVVQETDMVTTVFQNIAGTIEKGLMISSAVAVIICILVYVVGDIILEGLSAAAGALILINLAEVFVPLSGVVYIIVLAVLTVVGIIAQNRLGQK